jgi:hypothetical protein
MGKEHGYNVRMSIAGSLLNGTTSISIDRTIEMLDVTTTDSSNEKEKEAGEGDLTMSVDLKVEKTATYGIKQIETAVSARAAVAVVVGEGVSVAGGRLRSFNALLSGYSETADMGDVVLVTLSLEKTGSLTIGTSATTLL